MTDPAMYALPAFELPLSKVPPGFEWDDRSFSTTFTEETVEACVIARDTFRGSARCVVCGECISQVCRIIAETKYSNAWDNLRKLGWLPEWANENAEHEPRNAFILCPNHKVFFESYTCFIRYVPSERKFIFVNYNDHESSRKYYGKAVALDISDECAPFPALFLLHEQRVRGFQPFCDPSPLLPKEVAWQDWLSSRDILRPATEDSLFYREGPPPRPHHQQHVAPVYTGNSNSRPKSGKSLALNSEVIAEILAASRESPTWKAAVVENTSWDGTAEENVRRYQDIMDGRTEQ